MKRHSFPHLARGVALLAATLFVVACNTRPAGPPPITGSNLGPDEIPLQLDLTCPGDPACPDKFDPVWLAGRDSGTLAFGVHDPIWLRCYVLRQNQTTLAHYVVDGLGYMENETVQIRPMLDPSLGVSLLMMGATHDHQSKDMTGQWGPDDTETGYDPVYMAMIRKLTVEASS